MNKLSYRHVRGEKRNNDCISFCLFESEKFNHQKHILPFEQLLTNDIVNQYDILLFYKDENLLTNDIKNSPYVRFFEVTSDEKTFDRHLWRYMGCQENYDWFWFRGMDSPIIPPREIKLQNVATYGGCDTIIWSATYSNCMGKFALRKTQSYCLKKFLDNVNISHELKNNWHVDELLLSTWVDIGEQKILYVIDRPTFETPHKEQWIIDRLRNGNHTIIIKDRDDRPQKYIK